MIKGDVGEMPKLNSTVKSARVDNDMLAELEKRLNGKTYNAWLNEKIAEELRGSGKIIVPERANPTDVDTTSDVYEDLKGMVEFFGMTMDDFIQQADVALSEGVLTISEGKLVCVIPEWAQRLSDACHELGYDVEKIAESAVKSLGKGAL